MNLSTFPTPGHDLGTPLRDHHGAHNQNEDEGVLAGDLTQQEQSAFRFAAQGF